MSDFKNYNKIDFYENNDFDFDFMQNRSKTKKGFIFILSKIFFVLGFLTLCFNAFIHFRGKSQFTSSSSDMSYALSTIIIGILIMIVLFLLSTRVFKKKIVLLIFSIISLGCSFVLVAITFQDYTKQLNMSESAKNKVISLCNDIEAGKDISTETFDKSEYGTLTPVLDLFKDFGTKSIELSDNMRKDFSSINDDKIISLDAYSSVEKINNAKQKTDNSAKVYEKYEADYVDLMINLETSVSQLELPKSLKDNFLEGFRNSQIEDRKDISDLFKNGKDIFSSLNKLLDFMISSQGKYYIQNNQIVFKTNSSLNEYNNQINDIEKLVQIGSDIDKRIDDRKKHHLDELNNLQ